MFVLYPLIRTFIISFYNYGLLNHIRLFIGFGNYVELFKDPTFWIAIQNTTIILIGAVIIQIGLGLILAAIVNRGIQRGMGFFRAVFFAPVMMSYVAVGTLFLILYNPGLGIMDQLFKLLSLNILIPAEGWLGDPRTAIFAVLVAMCWQSTGFYFVIVLAGMQAIPGEIYEAALLDGANELQTFFQITIPCIRNVIFVAILINMIGALKTFDQIYVMTSGGPGGSTQVLGTEIYYTIFRVFRLGYASSMAAVVLIIAIVLGLLQIRSSRAILQ